MSERWRLARLVRQRIRSILKDAGQLRELAGPEGSDAVHDMRHSLGQALIWAEELERIFDRQGEAEDDGT